MIATLKKRFTTFGSTRSIFLAFVIVLYFLAFVKDMQVAALTTDSFVRISRNLLLVLALLPGVQGGIGLNFGLPLGILCGLIGLVVTMSLGLTNWLGFGAALTIGTILSIAVGFGYGYLLNKVRGQEMTVGTYVGFASVSLLCIFWLIVPIHNPDLIWAVGGSGLRTTLSLEKYFSGVLDHFLFFKIGSVGIPTGAFLFGGMMCFLVSLFFKSKTGQAVSAAGQNERFAKACGINPEKTRIIATTLSTVLAAVGIITYCQSFGFVQLYTAPLLMAFPAIACLLIGGANTGRATLSHVIFGTVIFQTLLTIALPVASAVIGGDVSDIARIIISNGIILYALVGTGDQS